VLNRRYDGPCGERIVHENDTDLEDHVEADETAYGGKPKASATRGSRCPKRRNTRRSADRDRGDGRVRRQRTRPVQPRERARETVSQHVHPTATVYGPAMFTELLHRAAATKPLRPLGGGVLTFYFPGEVW
jgi:hypothetical protein